MTPKLRVLSGKEMVKILKKEGFIEFRQKGSHLHMKHKDDKTRWASIPIHGNEDLPRHVIKNIIRTAKLSEELFK
jgi:predicted RNA binding protein YcfA (HicA-like mRNA interferase family)